MWIQFFKRHLLLTTSFTLLSGSAVFLLLFIKSFMTGGGRWPWISHMVSLSSFHTTWYNFLLLADLFKVLFSKYLYFCVVFLLELLWIVVYFLLFFQHVEPNGCCCDVPLLNQSLHRIKCQGSHFLSQLH